MQQLSQSQAKLFIVYRSVGRSDIMQLIRVVPVVEEECFYAFVFPIDIERQCVTASLDASGGREIIADNAFCVLCSVHILNVECSIGPLHCGFPVDEQSRIVASLHAVGNLVSQACQSEKGRHDIRRRQQ